MTDRMEADFLTLGAASRAWDGAADSLDGAWRRLHGTSGSPMDPGVATAFETFRECWVDEVKRVATKAQAHSESLSDAVTNYAAMDASAYEQLRALLPFGYRNSTLDPDGGPLVSPSPLPGPSPTPPGDSPTEPAPPEPSPGPSPTPSPSPSPTPTP